jgi:uncharacterized protein YdaU (DUF1376 family)
MSDSPYVPFYTSDFLGGTGGMTAATKGVYITLLCLIYEAEGPVTQKWDMLARRCGCTLPAFKKAVQDLVDDGKIAVVDEGIWSEKCEKHLAQRVERRSSAKAAAKKRWQKIEQKQGNVDAGASSAQCQPEPEPKRDTNVSLSKRARAKPERFQEFWDAYPHRNGAKKGRGKCEAKYARHVASGIPEHEIIDGARRYAGDRQVIDGYAKNPETWLNNEGWKDEIEPTGPHTPPRNTGRSNPHDSLVAGFAQYANSDGGSGETGFGGYGSPDDTGGQEMDCGPRGNASQPILRLIGSG